MGEESNQNFIPSYIPEESKMEEASNQKFEVFDFEPELTVEEPEIPKRETSKCDICNTILQGGKKYLEKHMDSVHR